jgi:hypothetical protein
VTFNHGVVGSSPTALTNEIKYLADFFVHLGIVLWAVCVGKSVAPVPAFDHTATGEVRAAGIARVFAARVEA